MTSEFQKRNLARAMLKSRFKKSIDGILLSIKRFQGDEAEQAMRDFLNEERAAMRNGEALDVPESIQKLKRLAKP